MGEFKKEQEATTTDLNDPVEIRARINTLTLWLSQAKYYRLRRNLKMSIDVLTKRLNELKQEGGE